VCLLEHGNVLRDRTLGEAGEALQDSVDRAVAGRLDRLHGLIGRLVR
jgi:hypothetical protein